MLQFVISGIAIGTIYGLIALGLVLIHKATGVVNFAQGEMIMITTWVAWTLAVVLQVPLALAVIISLLFAAVFGLACERLVIHPFMGEGFFVKAVSTVGLFVVLGWVAIQVWGTTPRNFPHIFPVTMWRWGANAIAVRDLGIIVVTATVVLLLWLFFNKTLFGIAMRATADNDLGAKLTGIDVGRVHTMVWTLAAVIGGIAGILVAPTIFVSTAMMVPFLLKAFAAAIIGGFDSLPGAMIGGILLGVTENVVGFYSSDAKLILPFLLIVLFLIVRPQGLLGVRVEARV